MNNAIIPTAGSIMAPAANGCWGVRLFSTYDSCFNADPTTMIFMHLRQHYEAWPDGVVVLEEACNDFNLLNGMAISTQAFSPIFRKHAAELFGAEKFRSREGGYQNARSAVKGIKRKFI